MHSKKWRRALLKHRSEIKAFFTRLRQTRYDLIFDFQGNAKSGLITLLARGDCKVGYGFDSLPEKVNGLTTNKRISVPLNLDVRSRYLYLVRAVLGEAPAQTLIKNPKRIANKPTLMVCFGSNWKNKQLTDEQLRSLLDKIATYCNPRFIFIYGNLSEEQIARQLEKRFEGSIARGGMTLLQWQKLMEEMDLIVAMDSAALHLAATTATPTFSLFGPSSLAAYKPPGERHRALQGRCPYGVQFDKRCPRLRTCATGACLRSLSVDEIFSSLQQMLDRFLRLQENVDVAFKS